MMRIKYLGVYTIGVPQLRETQFAVLLRFRWVAVSEIWAMGKFRGGTAPRFGNRAS